MSNNHRKFQLKENIQLVLLARVVQVVGKGFIFVRLVRVVNVMFQRNLYVKYYSVKRHLTIPHFRNFIGRMGTSFGCNDLWDLLDGTLSGQWYSRQPLTNLKSLLSTETIPEIVGPKAFTHFPYSFGSGK